jgi:hypothetical protein
MKYYCCVKIRSHIRKIMKISGCFHLKYEPLDYGYFAHFKMENYYLSFMRFQHNNFWKKVITNEVQWQGINFSRQRHSITQWKVL